MRKEVIFAIALLILARAGFSWQLKLIKQIHIEEGSLFQSASFVVLEDGKLLFTDIKDKNNQLKIFNEDGKLFKAWGKMGPGPDEFGGLGFPDYQSPYLAVSDAGKHRIHVFEKISSYEFKKTGEIFAWEQSGNIKIYNNNVLISGYIVSPRGKKYVLFMRDIYGKETRYILPVEYRYGDRSLSEYEKTAEEVSGMSAMVFLDVHNDSVFCVSDVRLKIVRIDLKSNNIELIGKKTKNFRALRMDKKTRETLINAHAGREFIEDILTRHSFVSGIFADQEFAGVIYVNREKKVDDLLYYVSYVQLYDQSGHLFSEQRLSSFFSEEKIIPLYYQKEKRLLYLCSVSYSQETTKYVIYKYQLER